MCFKCLFHSSTVWLHRQSVLLVIMCYSLFSCVTVSPLAWVTPYGRSTLAVDSITYSSFFCGSDARWCAVFVYSLLPCLFVLCLSRHFSNEFFATFCYMSTSSSLGVKVRLHPQFCLTPLFSTALYCSFTHMPKQRWFSSHYSLHCVCCRSFVHFLVNVLPLWKLLTFFYLRPEYLQLFFCADILTFLCGTEFGKMLVLP